MPQAAEKRPAVVQSGAALAALVGEVDPELAAIAGVEKDRVVQNLAVALSGLPVASLDDPTSFTIGVPDTLIACSWELAVVHHERDAWGQMLSDTTWHIANGLHQSHGLDPQHPQGRHFGCSVDRVW